MAVNMVVALQRIARLETSLYGRLWFAHWNVEGNQFFELHKEFGDEYDALQGHIDDIQERVRQLGGVAKYESVESLVKNKTAKEFVDEIHDAHTAMTEEIIGIIGVSGKDFGSANLLTDIAQWHDKSAWKLRSF
jgi:starvation-inducible DNA-binding protein